VIVLAERRYANHPCRAIVAAEREAHYETTYFIVRLIIIHLVIPTSDIEPAFTNEAPKNR
jgi:hypothetical protein